MMRNFLMAMFYLLLGMIALLVALLFDVIYINFCLLLICSGVLFGFMICYLDEVLNEIIYGQS
jgi:membrane associated rhomboid family serine protease